MTQPFYQHTSNAVTVSVEVEYVPRDDNAEGVERHVWAYHITMRNAGPWTVQLKTRHWTIIDAQGRVHKVDGPGVVGETPVLEAGESFTYSSGCPLETDSGAMSGYYMFEREDGVPLKVTIPAFSLDLPGGRRVLN